MLQLFAGVLICLLGSAVAQGVLDKYTVKNFPDPVTNYRACGRIAQSYICDPNNILPEQKADEINQELENIYSETTVPCYQNVPRPTRRRGYMVMVAVLPGMERFHTVNTTGDYNMQLRFREAQYFAFHLGREYRWGVHSSQCDEMVIIFYSRDDGVLYTSTQPLARQKLTDEIVRDTVLQTLTLYHPLSRSPRRAANAIKFMVRQYGDVLREDVAPQ